MKISIYSRNDIKIALTGGGTGGHIFPLISVVRAIKKELKSENLPLDFIFFGPDDFSLKSLAKEGIKVKRISAGKINRFFSLANFIAPLETIVGFFQSLWHLYFFMPDVVFSKGGYGAVPVVLAARIYNIPVVIHESDSIPGLATRLTSYFAKKIFISFKDTERFFKKKKVILTGNPSRFDEVNYDSLKAKKFFRLEENKPVLLVLGGSQGSKPLNDFVLDILPDLISQGIQIVHQTGEDNFLEVKAESDIVLADFLEEERKFYHPVGFLDEKAYQFAIEAADLALTRAGSGALFDLAYFGKPAILVPYPFASRNHQRINASYYQKAGGGIIIEQSNLLPHLVVHEISSLLNDKERLKKMSEGAKKFAKPKAAQKIAKEIISLL